MRPTVKDAALIGYFMGDGSASPTKSKKTGFSVTLYGNYEGDQNFADRLRRDFGWESKFRPTQSQCWALSVPAETIRRMLALGVHMPCDSYSKHLPNNFETWPKNRKKAALSGLWQTDGYVGTSITYTTMSHELGKDVAILLEYFGIPHSLRHSKRGEWTVYVHKAGHKTFARTVRLYGKKDRKCKTYWTVWQRWTAWLRLRKY